MQSELAEQVDETSMFALSWSYFDKNLKSAFANPRSLRKFSDVTFLCQDRTLHAHRIILHAGSEYFRHLFEDPRASNNLIIYMYHVKGIVLKKLLEYLYCGEVNVDKKHLQDFIMLGQSLKVKGLVNRNDETPKQALSDKQTNLKRQQDANQIPILRKKLKEKPQIEVSASEEDAESTDDESQIKTTTDRMEPENPLDNPLETNKEIQSKQDHNSDEELAASFRKTITKSFSRYQRIVANIKKEDGRIHEMSKGTRRRCGQCSIQKVEKRTSYYCKTCNIALCRDCFEPFHKTFDESSKINDTI